jgi:hypothetical protein
MNARPGNFRIVQPRSQDFQGADRQHPLHPQLKEIGMSNFLTVPCALQRLFAANALGFCGVVNSAPALLDAACNPSLTNRERHLVDLADQGTDELRSYLWNRRGVLQANIHDTAVWAESIRKSQASCLQALGEHAPSASSAQASVAREPASLGARE